MKIRLVAALLACIVASSLPADGSGTLEPPKYEIPYGTNTATGRFIQLNGIKLYFETYGNGQPMLQIHGNGQSIAAMGHQLRFFSEHYQVIAADSRGHGKSGIGAGQLTYEQMAEDANALLDKLGLKFVYVLGWSDGGIIGLLLAINHPDKVAKLAIMGANLHPNGTYDWARDWVAKQEEHANTMIAKGDKSKPWPIRPLASVASQTEVPEGRSESSPGQAKRCAPLPWAILSLPLRGGR